MVNIDRLAGAVAFLRSTFYNDGAEGESVHRVCSVPAALVAEMNLLRAVVDALPRCGSEPPLGSPASAGKAPALATKRSVFSGMVYCDAHAPSGLSDIPYADPLRALLR